MSHFTLCSAKKLRSEFASALLRHLHVDVISPGPLCASKNANIRVVFRQSSGPANSHHGPNSSLSDPYSPSSGLRGNGTVGMDTATEPEGLGACDREALHDAEGADRTRARSKATTSRACPTNWASCKSADLAMDINRKRFQGIKELEAHLENALSGIGPVSIPNLSAAISVAEYQSLSQLSKVLPRPITSLVPIGAVRRKRPKNGQNQATSPRESDFLVSDIRDLGIPPEHIVRLAKLGFVGVESSCPEQIQKFRTNIRPPDSRVNIHRLFVTKFGSMRVSQGPPNH